MNKFYVYTMQSEEAESRSCIYVDEQIVNQFAQLQFKPDLMEYSGVAIEADTPHEAHEIYNNLQGGEILSAEEPKVTFLKRRAHEARKIQDLRNALGQAETAAARLALTTYAKSCTRDVLDINKHISRMAELVRKISKSSPEVSVEEIYERFKQQYIQQLDSLVYNDPRSGYGGPDEWEGGGPTNPGILS